FPRPARRSTPPARDLRLWRQPGQYPNASIGQGCCDQGRRQSSNEEDAASEHSDASVPARLDWHHPLNERPENRARSPVMSEVDELFGLPLEDFTRARNDLARRLKKEGKTQAADEVGALPKPTVPAWTINQLSRVDRRGIQELLEAGDAPPEAQQRLLRGGDRAGAGPREATPPERPGVGGPAQRARALVARAKRPATAAGL